MSRFQLAGPRDPAKLGSVLAPAAAGGVHLMKSIACLEYLLYS